MQLIVQYSLAMLIKRKLERFNLTETFLISRVSLFAFGLNRMLEEISGNDSQKSRFHARTSLRHIEEINSNLSYSFLKTTFFITSLFVCIVKYCR